MSRVELRVQGVRFVGWTAIEVSVSIESACRTFSLEAIRQTDEPSIPVPRDADCEVWLDGVKVCTGVTGKVSSTRTDKSNRLSVTGRSKTREIVDCSIDGPGAWHGRTVGQIAADVCDPYGIEVLDLAGDTTPIASFRARDPKEKAYSVIERAARVRSLLVTDDAEGRLVLTRAGSTRAGTIQRGRNILESEVSGDSEGVYSEIRVKGVRTGDDGDFGAALFADATATDNGPRRRRVLVVDTEGRGDAAACQARARWEVATRYGKSINLNYTVPDWRRDDGALWTPNTITRVIDPTEYVDGAFLVVSAAYTMAADQFRTSLQLAPPEGFQLLELPTLATRGKKRDGVLLGVTDPGTIATTARQSQDVRGDSGRNWALDLVEGR